VVEEFGLKGESAATDEMCGWCGLLNVQVKVVCRSDERRGDLSVGQNSSNPHHNYILTILRQRQSTPAKGGGFPYAVFVSIQTG
jgi:hypothetical protein